MMRANPIRSLSAFGQSVWLDYLGRDILESGEFSRLVLDGEITGATSNPSIFEKAISSSRIYDPQIAVLSEDKRTPAEIVRQLIHDDVVTAADILQSTYRRSNGLDGLVSVEVSPYFANSEEKTVKDARRIWNSVDRPNVLIKIPATRAGLAAMEQLLSEGINVNATLLFDPLRCREVAQVYFDAITHRRAAGLPLDTVISVVSLFVSRIDTKLDTLIGERSAGAQHAAGVAGEGAIASARLAHEQLRLMHAGDEFQHLARHGARPQRIVWASTSVKNPDYPDTKYIEALVGPGTITTIPPEALKAFRDHGVPEISLPGSIEQARSVIKQIEDIGIDLPNVYADLEREGVEKFESAYDRLLLSIELRTRKLLGRKMLAVTTNSGNSHPITFH